MTQGTLLGPLLFLLYVNDIYKSAPVFSFTLYADDTNILYSDKDLTKIHNVVNDNLKKCVIGLNVISFQSIQRSVIILYSVAQEDG